VSSQGRAPHPHFEIVRLCGQGGMGEVYEGIDKRLKRRVALKFLSPELLLNEPAIKRFHREAAAIAALQHPHIAVLYEFGDWDGQPFLAMEYLPGGSLHLRIRHGSQLPSDTVLRFALQIGRGLAYAHRKGIVHRDIKPGNVMLTEEGDLKIVDFGLAKLAGSEGLTRTGAQLGTITYLAPELLRGAEASAQSDQFSYGVSLYEIATNVLPFAGDNPAAVMRQILDDDAASLTIARPDLPERFAAIVAQATSKKPENRFDSMDRLVQELEQLLPGSGLTPTHTLGPRTDTLNHSAPPRSKRRFLRPLIASGVLAAGLACAALIPSIREPIRNRFFGPALPSERSVMVLPLENIGADAANAAFCDGLTETLSSLLSQLEAVQENLMVIPANEARRGHIQTVREAARAFKVTLAITGSVERQPGSLRVILNLIDAKSLKQIGSRSRVADLGQAATLPDGLAVDLASLLRVSHPGATPSGTRASAAYDLYTQGKGLLEARKLDAALATLKKAVAADPHFADARAALAECYFRIYDSRHDAASLALADAEADRAMAANPGRAAHMVTGLIRQATGRYDDAIEEFGKLIALDPRDVEGYRLRAIALEQAGRVSEAENEYLTAVRFKPGYWRTYSNLGAFYKARGNYPKAAESLTMVTQLAPENAFGFRNLGGLYHLMGRADDAVRALQRSIELQPNAEGYSNLGTVLFFQKRYAEANTYYQKAVELSPRNPRLYGNMGDALWQIPGRRDQAREAFVKAAALAVENLNINPNNPGLRASYSVYLAKLGRTADAIKELSSAFKGAPDNVDILLTSARVHELAGDRSRALDALREALRRGYAPSEVNNEPDLTGLRSDPRFLKLVSGAGKGGRQQP
jgi:serine/threonine protein kinase/tetratricopeptide (TPR) repeat protein